MFRGSLPASAVSIISELIGGWQSKSIYIGCAGNFTIERGLASHERFAIHSNDVTLYSCALGAYLARQDFPVKLRPERMEEMGWLEPYVADPAGAVSTIMLCTRLLEGEGKKNAYYTRMNTAYRAQWPELYGKTRKKLEAMNLKLASFYAGDVVDWVGEVPDSEGFVCFPPFFAGDYENLFAKLDELFEWPKPSYPEMDGERRALLFSRMMAKRHWCFGTHLRQPELAPYLKGLTQTTNRGVPIFIYSNGGETRLVSPEQELEPVKAPRLSQGETIGDKMTLAVLTGGQFQSLRSQYMNPFIKPGAAVRTFGVLVDGKLVGVFAINPPSALSNFAGKVPEPFVYMLSDFPVAPTSYPRLAKLVLYAALSHEAKLLAERMMSRRVRGLVTTAFTKRPVSMKYRGLLELLSRKDRKPETPEVGGGDVSDAYYTQGYELNYGSSLGRWSLAEGLSEWKKKHGKFEEHARSETE